MTRWWCVLLPGLWAGLCACSSPADPGHLNNGGHPLGTKPDFDAGDPPPVMRDMPDSGTLAAPLPDGGAAPTWSYVYATYFGPGSLGHCGNSGCHDIVNNHFMCGTTAATCYQGLLDGMLIDTTNPTSSRLVDPNRTPLSWYNTGGGMPYDMNFDPNATAGADIGAWVFAGAMNN